MIIGTAGHIDHGKSALVTALTGRPMDRLAEERRRGISIDLNFAPLDLGDDRVAGVVDVPGHEDFVRTMVAGASGIDLVLLVIAADEGIMPQTEEHLAIVEYLQVPAGIPVLTKADLVDAEWLELLSLEVVERLARSPVAFTAPLAISAKTGQGLAALREQLQAYAATLVPRPAADIFRMPIDRAFSVAGVGTVVTGTTWSGMIEPGASVTILPAGLPGRLRSVESFGGSVSRSRPGARTALGLADVDRQAVRRGDVVVASEVPWAPVSALDVEIALHPSARRPLVARSRVRFDLGTAELLARVYPRGPIEPGGSGLARLSLETPAVARGGDRFVLRSYSPVITIGGGRVLDPAPPQRGATWPPELASAEPAVRLRALLARRPAGIVTTALPLVLGVPPTEATALAAADASLRRIGEHWIESARIEAVAERALELVRQHHRHHKSDAGMPLETLRRSLRVPTWQAEAALADVTTARRLRSADGVATLPGFLPRVEGGDAEIDRVVEIVARAGLMPPSIAELEQTTRRPDLAAILRLAAGAGRLEAVERDRYYARQVLDDFTRVLREIGAERDIVPAEIRERLGISRKYLIPLLEWADAKGITIRVGNTRRLKP